MDKYRLLPKQKDPQPINEIRVKATGIIRNYVAYAATLFLEKNESTVVLKGVGNAIPRVIQLAEIIRRRVKGLHQLSKITSNESIDTYQPLEEEITLSRNQLDTQNVGYQPPLPDSEVKVLPLEQLRRPQFQRDFQGEGGNRGRSSRGNRRSRGGFRGRTRGRGQGRGYGRGYGRGQGRGQRRGSRSRELPRGRETFQREQQ